VVAGLKACMWWMDLGEKPLRERRLGVGVVGRRRLRRVKSCGGEGCEAKRII
jgi:hypothetical protein